MKINYSVKDQGDGVPIKERYAQFKLAVRLNLNEIAKHDAKMAASGRRLFPFLSEEDQPHD
jgi:hypothetical protein